MMPKKVLDLHQPEKVEEGGGGEGRGEGMMGVLVSSFKAVPFLLQRSTLDSEANFTEKCRQSSPPTSDFWSAQSAGARIRLSSELRGRRKEGGGERGPRLWRAFLSKPVAVQS